MSIPEMYPVEVWTSKSLKRLKEIAEARPHLYRPSKDRYRRIADNCYEMLSVISRILEDDKLECIDKTDSEFECCSSNDSSMQASLVKIQSLINSIVSSNSNQGSLQGSSQATLPSTSLDRADVKVDYLRVLEQCASTRSGYPVVDRCSKFLYDWYRIRFFQFPDFLYNIVYLPYWIEHMVVLFSWYHSCGRLDELDKLMDDWFRKIADSSSKHSKYAMPYEGLSCEDAGSSKITVTSLVIWDVLMDIGLAKLDKNRHPDCFMHPLQLMEVAKKSPSVDVSEYADYTLDPSILDVCNISCY